MLLLTLDNLGIQIKPLLAGLGIGGIAVALAAQNILGDLFASLSITLDRPFVLGDTLQVDDFVGTVEYIGVKSTRLRSVNGEQIIMPNSNLLASRVRNLTRATERRVVFTISVGQETPPAQLQKIPGLIRSLIEAHRDVRFDRSHFAKIAAASFDFEAVYVVKTTDYTPPHGHPAGDQPAAGRGVRESRASRSRTPCSGCISSSSRRCSRSSTDRKSGFSLTPHLSACRCASRNHRLLSMPREMPVNRSLVSASPALPASSIASRTDLPNTA